MADEKLGPGIVKASVLSFADALAKRDEEHVYRVRFIVEPKTMTIRMELVEDEVTIEWDERAAEAVHDGIGSALEELRKYKPRVS